MIQCLYLTAAIMGESMNDSEHINALALDILKLSRNTLLVNLRFLDRALSMFDYVSCPDGSIPRTGVPLGGGLATDGKRIYYAPKWVLLRYRKEKEAIVRDYLHMVFHCVFHHAFVDGLVDIPRWNLACDIAVESAIEELHLSCAAAIRGHAQGVFTQTLKKKINLLTAEKIYAWLLDNPLSDDALAKMQRAFEADSHDIWYLRNSSAFAQDGEGEGEPGQSGATGHSYAAGHGADSVNLGQEWKDIAQRMQTDLENFAKSQGEQAGSMMQSLREVNRERYDYTAFLRKFAVPDEAMKINDDEFDYIFYTYGMSLYGKMPLVEPLEYKEVRRIREFVIAIDTSGSVQGDTVQRFLNKTWNILKQQESFSSRINLHIIQCDAEIQEDTKITGPEEIDEYIKTMRLRGFGGTDFRPVFEYVDRLRREKEFANLGGLIYFTDGYGDFPEKQPDYRTAFVFLDEECNNYDVPVWAIRLVLRRDEI